MKTSKTILSLIAVILTSFHGSANSTTFVSSANSCYSCQSCLVPGANDSGNKYKILKQIRQFVRVPEKVQANQTCTATVFFSVDQNGKVNDVFVKTNDDQVKKDLENQFLGLS